MNFKARLVFTAVGTLQTFSGTIWIFREQGPLTMCSYHGSRTFQNALQEPPICGSEEHDEGTRYTSHMTRADKTVLTDSKEAVLEGALGGGLMLQRRRHNLRRYR